MRAIDFAAFEQDARAAGYDEVLQRRYGPNEAIGTHHHDFDVEALVAEGEMWLTVDGHTHHLRPGDPFSVARGAPHAERYGAQGAVAWVARRHGR